MPTNETDNQTLTVREITQIVQEWVDLHASRRPNFVGAYLWGGITALTPDAPFHLYRDVDVALVSTHAPAEGQDDTEEELYRGVMLEILLKSIEAHQDAEAVLANPSHGPNMATTHILADPTGILAPLQQRVAAEYGRRRWIQA